MTQAQCSPKARSDANVLDMDPLILVLEAYSIRHSNTIFM